MTKITRRGETVDVAIQLALQEIGATQDEVEIEIIDSGKKGFFGFGARDAEVTVTLIVEKPVVEEIKEEPQLEEVLPTTASSPITEPLEEAEVEQEVVQTEEDTELQDDELALQQTTSYLRNVAISMGIEDLDIQTERHGKYVTFQLDSSKAAFLIGKRGQTLNALQQLAQLVTNKFSKQFKVVRLDVGDYRDRREVALEQLADRMADRAVRNGRKVQLEPMPSYERKVIHNALSNRLDIETYSEGTEPHRYLVIEPIV